MKYRPVGHRILIQLEQLEEKYGDIVLVRHNEKAEQSGVEQGTVLALGPQAYQGFGDGAPWVQVGDKVKIIRYAGVNFVDEATDLFYRIVNDDDIYAIVEE